MPRTHYIEHPLRNAERLLRYGVRNADLIIAAILHDTVEDGYVEMCELQGLSRHEASLSKAVEYIADQFGVAVAAIVLGLTNAPAPKGSTKSEERGLYAEHVRKSITNNPLVWLGKFVDWVDNAAGLHHNVAPGNEAMIQHLALKYEPLVEIFEDTMTPDIMNLVSDQGFNQIREHLDSGSSSLKQLLSDPKGGTVLL
jgi:(p)ppGpp synthase/HD superfamily hydrolase